MPVDLKHVFPRVPIIGGEPRVVKCSVFDGRATILCDCGNHTPIDIPSFNRAGFCVGCKQKYVISKLAFMNNNGQVSSEIEIAKWGGAMSASKELEVGLTNEPELTRKM